MTSKPRTSTAASYEEQQREEWSQYIAAVPIDYYGTRAYNTGDPVPASAVGDDPAAGRWVSPDYVRSTSGRNSAEPFEGSTIVGSGEAPTINPSSAAAAPAVSSPVDPASTVTSTEG